MGFAISPQVVVKETDLSSIIPAVATTGGATVGYFPWGPVLSPQLISSEKQLASTFGAPVQSNFNSFFTAANFLAYSNSILVTRVIGPLGKNACVSGSAVMIAGDDDYDNNYAAGQASVGEFAAKYPGVLGNSLSVSVADVNSFSEWQYQSMFNRTPGTTEYVANQGGLYDELFMVVVDTNGKFSGVAGTVLERFQASKAAGAKSYDGSSSYYEQVLRNSSAYVYWMDHPTVGITGTDVWGADLTVNRSFKKIDRKLTCSFTGGTGTAATAHVSQVGSNGEILAIAIDTAGAYSVAPTAMTIAVGSSFVSGTITTTGTTPNIAVTGVAIATAGSGYKGGLTYALASGVDDYTVVDGDVMKGYDLYKAADLYDVALIALGNASSTVANYVISNIAEVRKDCVVFCSPTTAGAPIIGSDTAALTALKAYKTAVNIDSSYGFMDTGCKYQYDKYNDKFRWITLNGDIAGLCARTDAITDPWFSPGGLNRGKIKNCVKLAVNPDLAMRDNLYMANINPVVTFPGNGTVLFGDKTMQTKPSAFDRINVRRLFIVLEKAIATAAKYVLFEINDSFTQAQFRGMVEPFLRDVKGRRGLSDFSVICDSSNNTGEVVDRNEFVGTIFIKPARSINFITLNFVATRTDAVFSELVGIV